MDGDELVFLYQLKEGICQSSYAANIATLAGLPTSLVQRGVEVKHTHTHTHTHTQSDSQKHAGIDFMFMGFGQVSELYRTGRSVKRIDNSSSDEQANRLV